MFTYSHFLMLRSIFDRFNVDRNTALYITRRVISAINGLVPIVIKWMSLKMNEFSKCRQDLKLPVDSQKSSVLLMALINIPAPKHNLEAYINRKGHHSIQFQIIYLYILTLEYLMKSFKFLTVFLFHSFTKHCFS